MLLILQTTSQADERRRRANDKAVPLLDGAPPRVGKIECGLGHANDIDEAAAESKSRRRLDRGTSCDFGLEYCPPETDEG
jgi:hypothetical protein